MIEGRKNIMNKKYNIIENSREWFQKNNPILEDNQIGVVEDNTDYEYNNYKSYKHIVIGDGNTYYNDLTIYDLKPRNDFYVDPVNGIDDLDRNGTFNRPYKTIQFTINSIAYIDSRNCFNIYLADGEYKERISLSHKNINIFGNTKHPENVRIGNYVIEDNIENIVNVYNNVIELIFSDIRIYNCTFVGEDCKYFESFGGIHTGNTIIKSYIDSDIDIYNCIFEYSNNNTNVIDGGGYSDIEFWNCKFIGNRCRIFVESNTNTHIKFMRDNIIESIHCDTLLDAKKDTCIIVHASGLRLGNKENMVIGNKYNTDDNGNIIGIDNIR
jgi:hypothetical protein